MAKHAQEKKPNLLLPFLIILVLAVIGIIIYFYIISYLNRSHSISNVTDTDNAITILESTTYKVFEDSQYLRSEEFDLVVNNGISTINGKIFNNSDKIITNLNCLYTLKDSDNNTVYEFTIYAKQIEPQDYFGFTSVVILDLSNIKDYSVKLYDNQ